MKTITQICLALLLTAGTALKAQNSNNLVVFSESGDRFYLILNGLKYNQSPETNVKVTGLNAAQYKAKIIFEKPAADLDGTVHLMWEGVAVTNKEFSYEVVRKGDHHKLRFISQADIGSITTSNSVVYNADGTSGVNANIGGGLSTGVNNGSVTTSMNGGGYNSNTTVTTTTTAASGQQGGNVGINMNVDGMNMSVNVNGAGPANGVNTTGTTTVTTTTYSSSSTSSYGNVTAQNTSANTQTSTNFAGCAFAMSDDNFAELVNSINAKPMEDARLAVAKQGVSANCVSAAQVRKLMDLFSFEDNKLALTKFSYDRTVDKNNYFKVNDGFSFDSSVDSLNDYISQKK